MTPASNTPKRPWRAAHGPAAALVGLLLALAGIVVGAVPAAAQNAVGASTTAVTNTVGPPTDISAGQRLGEASPQPQIVVATAVAAKSAPEAAAALKGPIADQVARNLPQQLALGAARDGQGAIIMRNLGDAPRLMANYGEGNWVKMQYVLRGNDSNVTVHYFRNLATKMDVEFKFK